jgi:hypothetical protein
MEALLAMERRLELPIDEQSAEYKALREHGST